MQGLFAEMAAGLVQGEVRLVRAIGTQQGHVVGVERMGNDRAAEAARAARLSGSVT